MLRTLLCIGASPFIALAMLTVGVLAALVHLVAMPLLYLWELRLERRPLGTAGGSASAPGASATRAGQER